MPMQQAAFGTDKKTKQHILRLVDVARLYYEEGLTQEAIAKRIKMSRLYVNRLLGEARQAGIVKIEIHEPFMHASDLREALLTKYGLQEALVVPCFDDSPEDIAAKLGRAGAMHVEQLLKRDDYVVGVGWGRTVYELSRSFDSSRIQSAHFIPLIGSIAEMSKHFQPNDIVRRIAEASGCSWSPLQVPFMMDSYDIAQCIMGDSSIKAVVDEWDRVDIAIVGVGSSIGRSPILRSRYFDESQLHELQKQNMLGDICSRFFNDEGEACSWSIDDRLVGITLAQIKRTPNVVAVAGGKHKAGPIRAAMNAGYINTLVTDEQTAQLLIAT